MISTYESQTKFIECALCHRVILWEKMITPDGRIYHIHCWDKFEEIET